LIERSQITGLVLAGGRGTRMGGADKGLQTHLGQPLVRHALDRLAPQVASLAISANRNLDAYRAMGVPVWSDGVPDFPGPLAGFLAGLEHADAPLLATVPCDCPAFPADLVQRLAIALDDEGAELAIAATREGEETRLHPVFCLMRAEVADSLRAYVGRGQRKVAKWTAMQRTAIVVFDDNDAFTNVNTAADLAQLREAP
jgi:molybdopterin-guanine dinucleotide biosynthesis protein A